MSTLCATSTASGSHCASDQATLAEAGIGPTVGSEGDSYDAALAETINELQKSELIYRRAPWKTKASVVMAISNWDTWFNHHRPLEPIGYIPLAKAEANYYLHLANRAATAAWTKPTSLHETRRRFSSPRPVTQVSSLGMWRGAEPTRLLRRGYPQAGDEYQSRPGTKSAKLPPSFLPLVPRSLQMFFSQLLLKSIPAKPVQ